MAIEGSSFYNTPEGVVNVNILVKNSAKLNDDLIRKYGNYRTGLIMGYGDGWLVEYFKNRFSRMAVIEGSKSLFDSAVKKYRDYPHITCHHSYYELFKLPKKKDRVDVVLGNHVLEHVDDPAKVLERSKSWLKETGYAIFFRAER